MKNMKDGPAKKQVQKRAMQILKQKKMCAARPRRPTRGSQVKGDDCSGHRE